MNNPLYYVVKNENEKKRAPGGAEWSTEAWELKGLALQGEQALSFEPSLDGYGFLQSLQWTQQIV